MNYCGFDIQPFCSDVCGDHRRLQTLAEICRNMGICYGFRSVAARVKYPGFMWLHRRESHGYDFLSIYQSKLSTYVSKMGLVQIYFIIRPAIVIILRASSLHLNVGTNCFLRRGAYWGCLVNCRNMIDTFHATSNVVFADNVFAIITYGNRIDLVQQR